MFAALTQKIFRVIGNNTTKIITPVLPKVKKSDIAKGYLCEPSLASFLPWRDYNAKHKLFLLEDNKSVAACFHLTPIPCEARPAEMMQQISKAIAESIKNSIPCEKNNPWILQVFIERKNDLTSHFSTIENYLTDERKKSRLTQAHLKTIKTHFDYVSREGGIYFDSQVTNKIFRGGFLKVSAVLYRRICDTQKANVSSNHTQNNRRNSIEELLKISRKFSDQLRSCGLKVKRMRGEEFYAWMVRWFNPKPLPTGGDVNKLIQQVPFPNENEKPFSWDLSENIFFKAPQSFEEGWLFDGLPHKVMTIQSLTANPVIGHLTAERKKATDDKIFNLIDHLPENSVFSMHIVLQAPSEVDLHLKTIHDSAVGRHAIAMQVKQEVEQGFLSLAQGDLLFPVTMALYLQGNDISDLHEKQAHAEVLLNSNGFKVISDDELFPIDAYIRYLPMCYDFHFDKQNSYRSRYILLSDIAKLLPFYSRSRGTENPGFIAFNRGGEPWFYDILKDRMKNAHMLLLGDTGTGKSNLINFLVMQMLAIYNPRIFIIEAGGSFNLLADYCKGFGLKVNKVKIDTKNPVSLNPFAQGLKVLEQIEALASSNKQAKERFIQDACEKLTKEQTENLQFQNLQNKHNNQHLEKNPEKNQNNKIPFSANVIDEEESRDILGDMVLAALTMITGGEKKEEDKITRADRMLIMDVIIDAALFVRKANEANINNTVQMIASDIVEAFERKILTLDRECDAHKIRCAREMADSMRYFTQDPVSSRFFNTKGEPWELADVTVVDFGLFAQEGYEAQRSIAFAGCVSKMLNLAEANQYSNRPIIAIFDENHLFTKLPLLASIQTRIAKMGRKLGLSLWVATQNVKDFADEASKMLSLIETWICLAVPKQEIEEIKRFKLLSKEQESMLLSARKEPKKYTEGVLLSPKFQGLFVNVPPRLYLAMAATEQHEKNERAVLMKQLNCSELEVVFHIAQQMMEQKSEEGIDE
jgi:conjugative transfer ATPase